MVQESVCVETREQIDAALGDMWTVLLISYILARRKGERVGHGSPGTEDLTRQSNDAHE